MIICKSKAELDIMHRANQIVAQVLGELAERVRPGASKAATISSRSMPRA